MPPLMRRLLLLLLAWTMFGAVVPAISAAPVSAPGHRLMPAMPGHCPDGARAGLHVCAGCALIPAERDAVPPASACPRSRWAPDATAVLIGVRTGFDPPPPRARG